MLAKYSFLQSVKNWELSLDRKSVASSALIGNLDSRPMPNPCCFVLSLSLLLATRGTGWGWSGGLLLLQKGIATSGR
jgi:hypothetical protein